MAVSETREYTEVVVPNANGRTTRVLTAIPGFEPITVAQSERMTAEYIEDEEAVPAYQRMAH